MELKIKDIVFQSKKWTIEELQEIRDIGPKVAESIYEWFRNERNIKFLEKLDKVCVKIEISKFQSLKVLSLKGKNFVLTGSLDSISRERAKEKIRELGGEISESVSKKTDYVVAGIEPGSKYKRAKELNIAILNEQEFLKMINA